MSKIKLIGQFDTSTFQRNLAAAKWAAKANFIELEVEEMFEFQWKEYCLAQRDTFPQLWDTELEHFITLNGDYEEELQQLYQFCEERFQYEESDEDDYAQIAQKAVSDYKNTSGNTYCFMKFAVNEEDLEEVEFELYAKKVPKTCENFVNLCKGVECEDGSYGYKDSLIHRIVPSGWIQGGDIIDGSKGDAGKSSLSDGAAFPDESFSISHDSRGVLSMANCGPHTNQSQFFVTLEAKRNLDRRFVAFGRVIRGSSVLGKMERMETFNDRPKQPIKIAQCGQV